MSIRTNLTAIMGATGLIAGCSNARVSKPDVRLPSAFEASATENRALASASLDRWWTLFRDPQLTNLVEQALIASPDARSAVQRIAEARATRSQSLAAYFLQGDLAGTAQAQHTNESIGGLGVAASTVSGAATTGATTPTGASSTTTSGTSGLSSAYLTPSGDLQTYGAQFNVSYQLDVFGRRRETERAADADVAAARFDYEATQSMLATNVATGLFQARGYALQLADARETLRIARSLARAAELSASHGLTSGSDAARLETDVATAEGEVARLEGLSLASRRSLLALVGRGTDPLDSLQVTASAQAPPAPPAVTPGELLARRPDVREADARLRSATSTLKLDKLALFPTFDLTPGAQLSKTAGAYDVLTTVWTVGLNAAMPILDRPRLFAVIRGQRARGEEAVIAYEQAVQNAYRDAENGLSTLARDRRRVDSLEIAVSRARYAFDAKRRGFDLGLTDLTTLLDAERSWRQATSTLSSAETTALVDAATLFQALGGGWSPIDNSGVRLAAR